MYQGQLFHLPSLAWDNKVKEVASLLPCRTLGCQATQKRIVKMHQLLLQSRSYGWTLKPRMDMFSYVFFLSLNMLDLYFWRGFYIHDHLNMSQSIPPASKYDDLQSLKSTEIHQKERCFSFHVSIAFLAETSCSYRVFIRRKSPLPSWRGGPMIHQEIVQSDGWNLCDNTQCLLQCFSSTISPLTLMCAFEKLWFFSQLGFSISSWSSCC